MADWDSAETYMMRNADLNRKLFEARERLCREQAREVKLEEAIDKGRIYGLAAQKCDMRLRREIDRRMRHPPVSAPW